MSIPLVQNNEKDSINTSIIAIKRNIERINMLLGLVDNDSPDLSGFATKQELQDAVTELQPVDEVTSGNMHSVTSNAVYEGLHLKVNKSTDFNFTTTKNGVTVKIKNKGDFTFVELSGTSTTDMYHQVNFDDTIPSAYRPSNIGIFPIVNRAIDAISGFLYILNNGTLFMYFPSQISVASMFSSGVYLN